MPLPANDGKAPHHAELAGLVQDAFHNDAFGQWNNLTTVLAHLKVELLLHPPVFGHPAEGFVDNGGTVGIVRQALQWKNNMLFLIENIAMELLVKLLNASRPFGYFRNGSVRCFLLVFTGKKQGYE